MDSHQFDALSRSLATAGTRRSLMRLFGVLPLVGTLAAVLAGDTVAKDRRGARRGHHGRTHASGRSRNKSHQHGQPGDAHAEKKKKKKKKGGGSPPASPPGSPPASPPPPSSGCTPSCQRKICGDDGCGGDCGTCGVDQVCAGGRCVSSCPGGQKLCRDECIPNDDCCTFSDCPPASPSCCGGACVADLTSNAKHCGTCATDCTALAHAATSTCSAGTCILVCDSGYADCNTVVSDGCEVNTQIDTAHCGSCPQSCGSGQVCNHGNCCTPTCTGKCGGASDGCGGTCTAPCPECQTCSGGICSNQADGVSCTFTSGGFPARGLCVNGTCSCKPNGAPCDCLDRPSAAGCCGGGCGPAPGGSSCTPNGICYQGHA